MGSPIYSFLMKPNMGYVVQIPCLSAGAGTTFRSLLQRHLLREASGNLYKIAIFLQLLILPIALSCFIIFLFSSYHNQKYYTLYFSIPLSFPLEYKLQVSRTGLFCSLMNVQCLPHSRHAINTMSESLFTLQEFTQEPKCLQWFFFLIFPLTSHMFL